MGAIQSSVNQVLGVLAGGKLIPTMNKANQNVEDIKLAKQRQRENMAKSRANTAKAKLSEYEAKTKLKELKGGISNVSIGGVKVTDPNILKQIKGGAK